MMVRMLELEKSSVTIWFRNYSIRLELMVKRRKIRDGETKLLSKALRIG